MPTPTIQVDPSDRAVASFNGDRGAPSPLGWLAGDMQIGSRMRLLAALLRPVLVTTATYTVQPTDGLLLIVHTGPVTITFQAGANHEIGHVTIKDVSGNASAQNITVNAAAGETLDGSASRTLDEDYQTEGYVWTGTEWGVTTTTGAGGAGDMLAATYDPTTIAGDAFARANHTGTQLAATISDFAAAVAAAASVAANTAHSGGDGSDHANVATNTTHISSDGSDHGFLDQDVTSGASPTFDGANFTGLLGASLDNGGVTDAKLVDMAEERIKGRAVGAGTGDPTDLTPAQAAALIASVSGSGAAYLDGEGNFTTPSLPGLANVYVAVPGTAMGTIFAAITTEIAIWLPAGNYPSSPSDTVPAGVKLIFGDHEGVSNIQFTSTGNNQVSIVITSECVFSDLTFSRVAGAHTGCLHIQIDGAGPIEIRDCVFEDLGIMDPVTTGAETFAATLIRCTSVGVSLSSSNTDGTGLHTWDVYQCNFSTSAGTGNLFNTAGSGTNREHRFWDCKFTCGGSSNDFIAGSGHPFYFFNCQIRNYDRLGLTTSTGQDLVYHGCTFEGKSGGTTHALVQGSGTMRFKGCTFESPALSSTSMSGNSASITLDWDFGVSFVVTATPDTIEHHWDEIFVDLVTPGAVALNAPKVANHCTGRFRVIDRRGDAGTNNITITRQGSDTIDDGSTTYVIDTDGGWVEFERSGTDWTVVARSKGLPAAGQDSVTSVSTTSGTLEDITGLTFTIDLPERGRIHAVMTVECSAAGVAQGGWAVNINAVDGSESKRDISTSVGSVAVQMLSAVLDAGTYTVKGRHRRVSGGVNVDTDMAEIVAWTVAQ